MLEAVCRTVGMGHTALKTLLSNMEVLLFVVGVVSVAIPIGY